MEPIWAQYDRWQARISKRPYSELRTWRNRLWRDIENGWVYRHGHTSRTRYGDGFLLAWLNAEIARRIVADPMSRSFPNRRDPT